MESVLCLSSVKTEYLNFYFYKITPLQYHVDLRWLKNTWLNLDLNCFSKHFTLFPKHFCIQGTHLHFYLFLLSLRKVFLFILIWLQKMRLSNWWQNGNFSGELFLSDVLWSILMCFYNNHCCYRWINLSSWLALIISQKITIFKTQTTVKSSAGNFNWK